MPSEIVSLPPGTTKQMLEDGQMEVKTEKKPPIESTPEAEYAKQQFKEDFLGIDALTLMSNKCKSAGIDIEFVPPDMPFDIPVDIIAKARSQASDRGYVCLIRPKAITSFTRDRTTSYSVPVTLRYLINSFGSKNPFGKGKLFDTTFHKFLSSEVLDEELRPKYAFPTTHIVDNSRNNTYQKMQNFVPKGDSQRSAVETVWDLLLRYAVTGIRDLRDTYDWTTTGNEQSPIKVGRFDEKIGININDHFSQVGDHTLGICTQKDSFDLQDHIDNWR